MSAASPSGEAGFPESAFWDFSLAVYGRPGVADCCLALQDRHGLDVNLLLYCLWTAASGRGPLDEAAVAAARTAAEAWREQVIVPLRAVRRHLKPAAEGPDAAIVQPCRESVKAAELAAEHAQQLFLARLAPAPEGAGRPDSAAESLRAYLKTESMAMPDRSLWRPLLAAAFPDAPEAEIEAGLRRLGADGA